MKAPVYSVLHVERYGQGRPVVLLHGWGMHAGVFQPLGEQLAQQYAVAAVDLPGHGDSAGYDQFADLSQHAAYLVEQLSNLFEQGVTLLGWSLGGLLAQFIALRYPKCINNLVLLCSTPCFRQREDWACAIEDDVLTTFANDLVQDYPGTLSRFLALQFMGAQKQKENLRRARDLVFSRPQPRRDMLQQGLQLLKTVDLRPHLHEIHCPTLIINGERDSLVPTPAAQYMAETLPDARCVILKGAGHAPFLSHQANVNYFLERFLHEH